MAKKEVIYQGLIDLPVKISDTSVNSPDYFRVTKLNREFTAGVNIFEFKGNPSLFREGSYIYVEILDSNGDPVYYETDLDLESQSQAALISVFINQDTAPGDGTISICSAAYKDSLGNNLDDSKINVRWTTDIFIDPSKRNASEIVFNALPTVSIFGSTGSYTDFGYPTGNKYVTTSSYFLNYYVRNGNAVLITSSLSTLGFNTTAISANVQIPWTSIINTVPDTFGTITSGSIYTSSITNFSGDGIAFLATPITTTVNNSNSIYTPSNATILTASITYEQSASLSPTITQNSYNLATAYFSGLQPQTGTVSKIRSYYRSAGIGEYIFSNETDISNQSPESGFTSDTISASFAIATVHRNDYLDFKFEFINPYGSVSKQVLESVNNLFIGGNTYIAGDDNLLTGSLYVAGETGTGVEITGRGYSAMIRSLGYTGFYNATHGTGSGFVMYSGSIQPILGSSEVYSGVGLELVANSGSYFKYATSGSGLLNIRTTDFYLGNSSSYIYSTSGSMTIYSPYFTVSPTGIVTASAIHVDKSYTIGATSYSAVMIDTTTGILDAKNLGRNIYSSMTEYTSASYMTGSPSIPFTYFSGSTFIFQGLPNEFRYTVTYQQRVQVGTLTGVATAGSFLRFRLYSCNSGSGLYDDSNFTLVSTNVDTGSLLGYPSTILVETVGNSTYDITFSEDLLQLNRGIDVTSSLQGKLYKGVIDFGVRISAGSPISGPVTASFKNISVTGTRGMVGVWNGSFSPASLLSSF
jgi:hypothetical protein